MLPHGNAHDRVAVQAIGVNLVLGSNLVAIPAGTGVALPGGGSPTVLYPVQPAATRPEAPSQPVWFDATKRIFDVALSLILLALMTPLFIIVGTGIRLTSRGPALYRQRRLTAGGREFDMLKFRTMIHDAEKLSGPQFAEENDPRVTFLGRILRKTRIDELPQLLNVVRGEMSLIGPRPERPEIASSLESELPHFSRRLEVKGGITGLAQVTAGYAANVSSYRHKLTLDLLYIENRCWKLELIIALQTVRVVLTGSGSR